MYSTVKPVLSRQSKIDKTKVLMANGNLMIVLFISKDFKGAHGLSSRVLDSRPKGRGFEPHWRHCVVVLEQDTFILA